MPTDMAVAERTTWAGPSLTDSVANLRAGGKSDAAIARILGVGGERARDLGLRLAEPTDPPAGDERSSEPEAPPITSAALGPRPSMGWIRCRQMVVRDQYQRELGKRSRGMIKSMTRDWSWRRFQPLVVAPIGGDKYAVVDGQHRLAAAMARDDIPELPCYIIDAPDIAAEASSFISLNTDRIAVNGLDRFWAQLAAGDLTANRIKSIADKADVAIARSAVKVLPPRSTAAIAVIRKFLPQGDGVIIEAMQLLALAKVDVPDAFRAAPIAAVIRLLLVHGAKLDRERLVEALQLFDIDVETRKAKDFKKVASVSVETGLMTLLIRAYNKRKPVGRLDEKVAEAKETSA
jgi:hypothetical protein